MKRRYILLLAATGAMIVVAALAPREKQGLLILEWAAKAKMETPPVAILIEMGTKDTQPTPWSGKATFKGAKVVHREGYRFRPPGDKLAEPDGWEASSHRSIRQPPRNPAIAKLEPIATVGVVYHLADVRDDATLTVEIKEPEKPKEEQPKDEQEEQAAQEEQKPKRESATLFLKEVLAGKSQPLWNGAAVVRRVSTAVPIVNAKTEDDFPAAAYGPDGTLWVAYISYTLKDESRRVQQGQLKEQPQSFRSLYTPEFGDQLFVKYYRDGKWSEPIAITGPNEDLVRCAIAVEGDGTAWVAYSADRKDKYNIYVRPISTKFSADPNLPPQPGPERSPYARTVGAAYLNPVMCTDQRGNVHVAAHYRAVEGYGSHYRTNLSLQDLPWEAQATGGPWSLDIAAGPKDWRITYDVYADGDYDVGVPGAGKIAASSRLEARPSICYDPEGRLWIAYEEGPEKWGKDYGPFDAEDGNPLYNTRSVRVVCIADRIVMEPIAELPTSTAKDRAPIERTPRYAYPQIGIDGKGRIWLMYREKFGTRYSTHCGSYWLTFARRLEGHKWSEPIEIHHSCGLLDHRPVLLPHPSGGLLVIHNTDGRHTTPENIDNQIYMSYVDLPSPPHFGVVGDAPRLVPRDSATKDPKHVMAAGAERAAVKRIRDYRVEAGGKKYQLLRGEFHRHTEISWDGGPDGSLEDMFRYAIDAAAMDWIGNGDHDNGAGREYSWWLTQKFTDAYHVKGVFTPMFTYERSCNYPHGHRNCMFAQRGVRTLPRLGEDEPDKRVPPKNGIHADDTKMLYRYLKEFNGICAVHTSATSMGTDWRDNDPVVEPIVEIYQGCRMSYEYPDCPRAGYDPKGDKKPFQIGGWEPAGFIDNAFKKGYRLGFQSSSDHWSTHISYCIVLAEKNDREAILEAMKKRHVYGATDDIILDVRSGNHIMGDEFKTNKAPTFEIVAIGAKALARIDIVKDSEVVDTLKPDGREYRGKWTDPKPSAGVHYYYIRAHQNDDELAWSSPMWVEYEK